MKLIIRVPNWVGDSVMSLPTVAAAGAAVGADHVAIMGRDLVVPLFRNCPGVDKIIAIDKRTSGFCEICHAVRQIRGDRYDLGLILSPSFSSALIFRAGRIRKRIGQASDGRSFLLTEAVKSPAQKMHRVHQYWNMLSQLGSQKMTMPEPYLYFSPDDLSRGSQILSRVHLSYSDKYVAIAPQATAPSRRWGTNNYKQLAKEIVNQFQVKVILLGGASDFSAAEKVKTGGQDIFNLCGQTDLMAAAAILSHAQFFVGNDSGLAHLAGAAACPIVVLSGADDPAETSPLSVRKRIIIKDIDCISCVKNKCSQKGNRFMLCMKLISVEEVLGAAKEFIAV